MSENKKWEWIQVDGGTQKDKAALTPYSFCDICKGRLGTVCYDAKTRFGSWAVLCHGCFRAYGVGLGIGKGQKYRRVKTVDKN